VFKEAVKRLNRALLLLSALLLVEKGSADVPGFYQTYYSPDMEQGFLLADYSYFDESLDVLDYASKLNSTFRPSHATTTNFALGYRFLKQGLISYQRERSTGEITRDREPYQLDSDLDGDRIGVRWQIGQQMGLDWSLELAFNQREQGEFSVECYEYQGVVIGNCPTSALSFSDPDTLEPLPLLTTSANQDTWSITVLANHLVFDRFNLTHHVTLKRSDLEVTTQSPLFEIQSTFLLNSSFGGRKLGDLITSFKQDLPQETPWRETSIRYGASSAFLLADQWIANLQFSFLKTHRSGYVRVSGQPDYSTNMVLASSLWYSPIDNVSFFLEGMVTRHYLLGLDELTYNQRSAKFFEHPFAQLKAGIVLGF